jgi:hypothetical protein
MLLLPIPWSRYIDQLGTPRGSRIPFPADPRAVLVGAVDDATAASVAHAPPARALPGRAPGGVPYGSPIAMRAA